jgi:hypothetical protein
MNRVIKNERIEKMRTDFLKILPENGVGDDENNKVTNEVMNGTKLKLAFRDPTYRDLGKL